MSKKKLLIFGNTYMEFISRVKRAPERLETVTSNFDHVIYPGGYGVITAISAAKLGIDAVLCSRIGDDENGEKISKIFSNYDIDARFVVTDKRKLTGVNSVTVEENNFIRTVTFPGANTNLVFDDAELSFTSYPDAILINTAIREDLVVDIIKFANESNIPVILSSENENNVFDYSRLGELEIFLPDRETAYKISGIDPVDANTALHACVKIVNTLKCKYVVIKLGQRGTFVFDGTYSQIIPEHEVEITDRMGSGMIFDAALSSGYLELKDINNAAIFANAAVSFSITKEGAFTSIPDFEDVKELLDNR